MTSEKKQTIRLHPKDNIVVALNDLESATAIETSDVVTHEPIPAGHKIAIQPIEPGSPIFKYGQIIGFASQAILPGQHLHTHNVEIREFSRDYAIGEDVHTTALVPPKERCTFEGIVRSDGSVATRNFIGILPTVNCSASVTRFIADAFDVEILSAYPNIDGVVALAHGTGCGMPNKGEGFEMLQRTLAGYARHANFGGILLVGLGCEANLVDCLVENMQLEKGPHLRVLDIQSCGGTRETVRQGIEAVKQMLPEANRITRQPVPASHLMLGLECGGSDAYSGISANPALGAAADLLISHGGTAILSETPEIYGAEHLLTRRAVSQDVGRELIRRIRWWEDYTARNGAEINNNPSPGNKAGGLTTILEKSLGAVAKGGTTNLNAVFQFAEPVSVQGFVFMDTPGYDVVSITGMIAGGANMVCFTTGRGTVCGFKPVPTIKLATNTAMYQNMKDDIDINCGPIVDGEMSISEMGQTIFEFILDAASGKKTQSEVLGFGDTEFVPWPMGAML